MAKPAIHLNIACFVITNIQLLLPFICCLYYVEVIFNNRRIFLLCSMRLSNSVSLALLFGSLFPETMTWRQSFSKHCQLTTTKKLQSTSPQTSTQLYSLS